jgi:hypothetical protein
MGPELSELRLGYYEVAGLPVMAGTHMKLWQAVAMRLLDGCYPATSLFPVQCR